MHKKWENYIKDIENSLAEYNPCFDNLQRLIYEAMNYSLMAGGKRLRPVLLLEFCRMFSGSSTVAVPFACAIEMIHTYSLIHDDLPAMDNDDLRRGKPTNHIVFGEANAILAGDALLTKAFEITASAVVENTASQLRAISVLASSAGADGMVGGQVVDIESENKEISIEVLKYIHRLKTGALIRASCEIGAILGGATDEELKTVVRFAENLGVAFQIRDDILDVTGDGEKLGKPIGSDEKCNKNTYVSLLGLDTARKLCEEYSEVACEALGRLDCDTAFLQEMTKLLVGRES